MKRITLACFLFFASLFMSNGQGSTEFAFTAIFAGNSKPLDSIVVRNLTRGTDTVLYGNDTVLSLLNVSVDKDSETYLSNGIVLFPCYPNPAAGSTNLRLFTGTEQRVQIIVSDLTGREKVKISQYLQTGYHYFIIDINRQGEYLVTVTSSHHRESVKLIHTGIRNRATEIRYVGMYKAAPGFRVVNSGFEWFPGDDLRFFGYSSTDSLILVHDVIEDDPVQSAQYNFKLITGLPCENEPFVADISGYIYRTVKIGTQCWMRENLRTNRLANGAKVPVVTDNTTWINLTTPGMCWYNNDSVSYNLLYGAFYNWYAISGGNLCPQGWHIPADTEWQMLESFLGMSPADTGLTGYRGTDQGGKLKDAGTSLWSFPNNGANNSSGFSALPAGKRSNGGGVFSGIGNFGYWWSKSDYPPGFIWYRILSYDNSGVFRGYHHKEHGYSVRCLRD